MCKLGVISQEWLKIDVKWLLSANRKSYMPRRLAQQRMTLSDLECLKSTLSVLCIISAIAELLVSDGSLIVTKRQNVPSDGLSETV